LVAHCQHRKGHTISIAKEHIRRIWVC